MIECLTCLLWITYIVHLEYHVYECDDTLLSLFSSDCTYLRSNTLEPGSHYIGYRVTLRKDEVVVTKSNTI